MTEQRMKLDVNDVSSILSSHVGGGMMHARLVQKGWEPKDIANECARILNEEWDVLDRYCGGELSKIEAPAWKLSMAYHTAMRVLNDREGVHGDEIRDSKERERLEKASAPREPVDSWYEKDLDDYDDLMGAEF